jgi:hypothetical protein
MYLKRMMSLLLGLNLAAFCVPQAPAQSSGSTNTPSLTITGITNGSVYMAVLANAGVPYAIMGSTDLQNWTTVGNVKFTTSGNETSSVLPFADTNATQLRYRFYYLAVAGTNTNSAPSTNLTVALISPTNGLYKFGLSIQVYAVVTDPQSIAQTLGYYIGSSNVMTSYVGSAYYWTPTNAGPQQVYAVVTDKNGHTHQSAIVNVTIDTNHPPVFTSGISVTTNSTGAIQFESSVYDYQGLQQMVEYYVDGVYAGTGLPSLYQYDWRGATGQHTVQGEAFNTYGATNWSAPTNFTYVPAAPPSITITNPVSGSFMNQSNIVISAQVNAQLNVYLVEFYANSNVIGYCYSQPYSVNWAPNVAGNYTLTATVTDDDNQTSTSDPAFVDINTNIPPTIELLITNTSTNITYDTSVPITVITGDIEHRLSSVYVYDGADWLASFYTYTNYFDWTPTIPGEHEIYAIATDQQGAVTYSTPIYLNVLPEGAPSITITSPVQDAFLTNPTNILVSATGSAPGSYISSMDFYCDGVFVATATYPPFSFTWKPYPALADGDHELYVVAYTGTGLSYTSSVTTFIVPPPSSVLLTPVSGSQYPGYGTVPITVTATNLSVAVTNVQIFVNNSEMFTITNAPFTNFWAIYSTNWSNVAIGTYDLYALTIDQTGATNYSTTNAINVISNPPPTLTWQEPNVSTLLYNQQTNWEAIPADNFTPVTSMTVTYFDNGVKFGQAVSASSFIYGPYVPAPGTHNITAGTANTQNETNTASITVTVLSNRPPVIALTQPANGAVFQSGAASVSGTATDPDRDLITVVVYVDGQPVATNNNVAGAFSDSVDLANGNHSIYATAQSYGFAPVPSATNIFNIGNMPPAFTAITLAGHGTNYSSGETITAEVTGISDPNYGSTVTSITFYVNNELAATVTNPGSTVVQAVANPPLAQGTYSIYAVLIDTTGTTAQTPTIVATVTNLAPTVTFLTPTNDQTIVAELSTNITIEVSAADGNTGGSVSNYIFYTNAVAVSTNTSSTWNWTPTNGGTYQLSVVAVDNFGVASAPASETVVLSNIVTASVLSLNGTNAYMSLDNPLPDMTSFTFEAWVYTKTESQYQGIFYDGNSILTDYVELALTGNTIFVVATKGGYNLNMGVGGGYNFLNTWHHVAWTVSSTNSQVFVDGNVVATIETGGNDVGYHAAHPTIGSVGTRDYFNGELDEIRIFNTVLTQAQIIAGINESIPGNTPSLVGYWNFDYGTIDQSPSGNNGTLEGGAVIIPGQY